MAAPNHADPYTTTVHHKCRKRWDEAGRQLFIEQYKDVRNGYCAAIDTWMANGMAGTAAVSAFIRDKEDEHVAEMLCRDMALDTEALAQTLLQDGINHFRDKYGANIPPIRDNANVEIIDIDSDTDEEGSNAAPDDDDEAADQDHAREGSHSLASLNNTSASRQRLTPGTKLTT
jgi:hypothetical protein